MRTSALRLRTREGCLPSSFPLKANKGLAVQERIRNKRVKDWKRIKLSLFADDLIVYIQNPKSSTDKLGVSKLIYQGSKI